MIGIGDVKWWQIHMARIVLFLAIKEREMEKCWQTALEADLRPTFDWEMVLNMWEEPPGFIRDPFLHSEHYQTKPTCLHLTKVLWLGNLSRHFYGWHCCTSLYWHQPRCTSLFYAAPHADIIPSCELLICDVRCVMRLLCCCHLLGRGSHQFMMSINDKMINL